MKMKQDIHIPDNIAEFLAIHNGVNLSINFNSVTADSGYAHMMFHTVIISMITRTCNRCGYDQLWRPDDSDSHCSRHTYNAWHYDNVFVWSDFRNDKSLEDAFEDWKASQHPCEPVTFKSYGQIGLSA